MSHGQPCKIPFRNLSKLRAKLFFAKMCFKIMFVCVWFAILVLTWPWTIDYRPAL